MSRVYTYACFEINNTGEHDEFVSTDFSVNGSYTSPNFRLMLSFFFGDFFHQSEVVRPYNRQVKKLETIFQKLSNLTS